MATGGGDDFNISCSYLDLGGGFKSFFCFHPENFGAFFLQFDVLRHILNHWVGGSKPPTHRNVDLPVASSDLRRRQDVNQGEDFENWRYDVALEVGWCWVVFPTKEWP